MKIQLIRHGEPTYVDNGVLRNDPGLTARGHEQAALAAERDWGHVDQLWVSPMVRAQETAAPIARALGIEPETHEWMHEIAMPNEWEGSPVDRFEEMFEELNMRAIEALWDGIPGGESFRDFHVRVTSGLASKLAERGARPIVTDDPEPNLWTDPDDLSIVFVAHGGTNAVTLGYLLGMDPTPWEWDRFDSAHTSVASIRTKHVSHSVAFGLTSFGDTSHLPANMVTR